MSPTNFPIALAARGRRTWTHGGGPGFGVPPAAGAVGNLGAAGRTGEGQA